MEDDMGDAVTPSRSSARLKSRQPFRMPSREEVLEKIEPDRTPSKSLDSLRPRKLVHSFVKGHSRYNNMDPISQWDDDSLSDFIANDDSDSNNEDEEEEEESGSDSDGREDSGSEAASNQNESDDEKEKEVDEHSDDECSSSSSDDGKDIKVMSRTRSSKQSTRKSKPHGVKGERRRTKQIMISDEDSESDDTNMDLKKRKPLARTRRETRRTGQSHESQNLASNLAKSKRRRSIISDGDSDDEGSRSIPDDVDDAEVFSEMKRSEPSVRKSKLNSAERRKRQSQQVLVSDEESKDSISTDKDFGKKDIVRPKRSKACQTKTTGSSRKSGQNSAKKNRRCSKRILASDLDSEDDSEAKCGTKKEEVTKPKRNTRSLTRTLQRTSDRKCGKVEDDSDEEEEELKVVKKKWRKKRTLESSDDDYDDDEGEREDRLDSDGQEDDDDCAVVRRHMRKKKKRTLESSDDDEDDVGDDDDDDDCAVRRHRMKTKKRTLRSSDDDDDE